MYLRLDFYENHKTTTVTILSAVSDLSILQDLPRLVPNPSCSFFFKLFKMKISLLPKLSTCIKLCNSFVIHVRACLRQNTV